MQRRQRVSRHPRDRVACAECGREARHPRAVYPYLCACGYRTASDGSGERVVIRGIGDVVSVGLSRIGVKKRKGCKCYQRQVWLNQLGSAAAKSLKRAARWMHPR